MAKHRIVALLAAGALMAAAAPALAQSGQPGTSETTQQLKPERSPRQARGDENKPAKVGEVAPSFKLTDLDGKEHTLAQYKGKVVVLEWFNPGCPVVVMHHEAGTMKRLAEQFQEQEVVWLAVNSGAPGKQGHGQEVNAEAKKLWGFAYPVLLDEPGKVGRAYGAKTTPHMYVINREGTLVYNGAIDDGNPARIGKTNYVEQAVRETLAGETVSTPQTRAFGCPVKY